MHKRCTERVVKVRTTLRELRKQHGWTASHTASRVGIKIRQYRYIESGQRNPSHEVAKKLARIFNVPQRELLEQSEEGGN